MVDCHNIFMRMPSKTGLFRFEKILTCSDGASGTVALPKLPRHCDVAM